MQAFVAATVDFTVLFLERSFQQDARFAKPSETKEDEAFFGGGQQQQQQQHPGQPNREHAAKLLLAAYKFMELTPPATHAEVKKQYKKLSLRYHPDRNGGSQESQQQMQKLNACMDLIEKDIAGVDDETQEDHREDDEEDPREAYLRRRKEMQEEMQREMELQQKRKEQFETNKESQKEECENQTKALKLDTEEGREKAKQTFLDQVKRMQTQTPPASSGAEKKEDSDMKDIDGDDSKPSDSPHKGTDGGTVVKPRNEIMECNANEVVIAIRMGLPEIAIPLLQQQLQEFFSEAVRNMHFDGIKKTTRELRLEFLQQPLDEDDNSILHYSVYYESYQVTKTICQVALQDLQLDAILSQSNLHGHTPLFFAQFAQKDSSILPLIESQLDLAELIRQRTQVSAALKAAMARIGALCRHVGLATTLSTFLSVCITSGAIFDLHPITTLVGLLFVQTFGRDRGTSDEVPGIKSIVALFAFGSLWTLVIMAIEIVLQYVMVEFLAILAPIVIAGLVSSGRRQGGKMAELLLLPLRVHAWVSRHVEPVLTVFSGHITPKALVETGWVRPYLLLLVIVLSFGVKRAMP